jgi:hypothetical protein
LAGEKRLVGGRTHLEFSRQVHPELHHLQRAAEPRELPRVFLLMDHPGGRRHPLHVPGTNLAVIAGRVPVLQFPLIDNGDSLKAPVRMFVHPARIIGRRELHRPSVIQQQERADAIAEGVEGEHGSDGEPVAHPVGRRLAYNAHNFLHGK